jgi:hypothetical protein
MAQPEARTNPLARRPQPQGSAMHPIHAHALMWQHVQGMDGDTLAKQSAQTDYILPLLGELAGNPKVTSKDVIKAASQAAADEQVTPVQAVQFISGMPDDPAKLQGWLRNIYAAQMSAAVHMAAAKNQRAQSQQVPAGAEQMPPTPTSMTPGRVQ